MSKIVRRVYSETETNNMAHRYAREALEAMDENP